MPKDDPVFVPRLQAMSAASSWGSVNLAYQVLHIPRSTFYRWRKQWIRYGPEILRRRVSETRSQVTFLATSPQITLFG